MKDINATVIIDVTQIEKKILKGLQKDARWGIKKAKKEGLIVEEANSDKEWENFYKIFRVISKEGGSDEQSLKHIKEKSHSLFVCKKDDKIIGGATIVFDPIYNINIPRLYKVAADKKYLHLQPNNLLYWHCIIWAKNKGYNKFDLGGWQINARDHQIGINKFKEKWGEVVYHKAEYPFFRAVGRKLIRNSKTGRLIWDKFKGRKVNF